MRWIALLTFVALSMVLALYSPAAHASKWDISENWDSGYTNREWIYSYDSPWSSSSTYSSSYGAHTSTYTYYNSSYSVALGSTSSSSSDYYYDTWYLNYTFPSATPISADISFWFYCRYMALYFEYSTNGTSWTSNTVYSSYSGYYGWYQRTYTIPSGTRYLRWRGYGYRRYYGYCAFIDDIQFKIKDVWVDSIAGYNPTGVNDGIVELTASADSVYNSGEVHSVEWQYKKSSDEDWSDLSTDTNGTDGWTALVNCTGFSDLTFGVRARAVYGESESDWVEVSFPVQDYNVTMSPPNPNGGVMNLTVTVSSDPFEALHPKNEWQYNGTTYYSSSQYYLVNLTDPVPFAGTAVAYTTNFGFNYGSYTHQFILWSRSGSTGTNLTVAAQGSSQYYQTGQQRYELTGSTWANLPAGLYIGCLTYYRGYHYYSSTNPGPPYFGNPRDMYYRSLSSTYWYSSTYYSNPMRVIMETTGYEVTGVMVSYRVGKDSPGVPMPSNAVSQLSDGTFLVNWPSWVVDSDDVWFDIRCKLENQVLNAVHSFGPYTIRNRVDLTFDIAGSPESPEPLDLNRADPGVYLNINEEQTQVAHTVTIPYFAAFDVEAPRIIPDSNGEHWRFDYWSDRGSRAHEYQYYPGFSTNLTAFYAKQVYFKVFSERTEFWAPAPGYYEPNTLMTIQASEFSIVDEVTRYRYAGYHIRGTGETGAERWLTVDLTERTEIDLFWQIQYFVTVQNTKGVGSGTPNGWYDHGTQIDYSVAQTVANGAGSRLDNRGYLANGVAGAGTMYSASLASPLVLDFVWTQQHYLTVASNYGVTTPPSGWFDEGLAVAINSTAPPDTPDQRYSFMGWSGTGIGSVTSEGLPTAQSVTINGPITQQGSWVVEFRLTLVNHNGTLVEGTGGWKPVGTVVVVTSDPPAAAEGSRWLPEWFGDGAPHVEFAPTEDSPTQVELTMSGPATQEIRWHLQHTLTILNPDGLGVINPPTGSLWYFDGDVVSGSCSYLFGEVRSNGFTGTGSAVSSDRPYFSFEILQPSSVSWKWVDRLEPQDIAWEDGDALVDLTAPHVFAVDFDENGEPVIAWFDGPASAIKVSARSNGSVATTTAIAGVQNIEWLDVCSLPGGGWAIVFYNPATASLQYSSSATFTKTDLTAGPNDVTTGFSPDAGQSPHVAVNASGDVFVSFYDLSGNCIALATLRAATQTWTVEKIDENGNPGLHNAISVREIDGEPAVVYHCLTSRELRYAVRVGGEWVISVIEDEGNQGWWPSLDHTPDGKPYVAYQNVTDSRNFHLRFAELTEEGWQTCTVDPRPDTGYNTSLRVGPEGRIHIAYHNLLNAIHAWFDGTVWRVTDMGGELVSGDTGIELLNRMPRLVFFDDGTILARDSKTPDGGDPGTPGGGGGGTTPTPSAGGGGGCFIATASFGSLSASAVRGLTEVRDTSVAASKVGQELVSLYYSASPALARATGRNETARALVRTLLMN